MQNKNILVVNWFKPQELVGGCETVMSQISDFLGARMVSWQDAVKTLGAQVQGTYYRGAYADRSGVLFEYLQQYEEMFSPDLIISNDDCAANFDRLKTPYACIFQNPYMDIANELHKRGLYDMMTSSEYEYGYSLMQRMGGKNSVANVAVSDYMKDYMQRLKIPCSRVIQ